MYLIDNRHHNLPHIHAKYAEFEASISIEDGEILAGELPRKQLRLVQAWIELHRDELKADWDLSIAGENRVFGNYRAVPQYIVVIESRSSQGAPP
jgi:hypothetical protein